MKALFVDLYDTIVRTEFAVAFEGLASRLGLDASALLRGFEVTRADRGRGRYGSVAGNLRAVAAACGITADDDLLSDLAVEVVKGLQKTVRLYDDVVPVLRKVRASGIPVALISNCDHATRPVVDGLGLERQMDAVVLSFEVGSVKPEPRIFTEAMGRLGALASDSVFVDDQTPYLDGAAALGMRTFRIVRSGIPGNSPESDAHPVISNLDQLLDRLRGVLPRT
jgi:putative hydrolase of the HAD superfamily